MASELKDPKGAKPMPPAADKSSGAARPPVQVFVEAYERYTASVQGTWSEAEKRSREASEKLLHEQQHAWSRLGSAESPAPEGKAGDAERAQQRWLQEQRQAWTESQRGYEEAYRQYVRRLREAWSQGDLDKLDAGSLLTIGQSVQAAAALAQSTMGAWSVTGGWETQPVGSAG